jgi:hypothetical protein
MKNEHTGEKEGRYTVAFNIYNIRDYERLEHRIEEFLKKMKDTKQWAKEQKFDNLVYQMDFTESDLE